MNDIRIDISSDTSTRPDADMLKAMAEAVVGDEQKRADPTVNALQERVAEICGTEAALFLPSGTMSNLIAVLVQCPRGSEIIAHRAAHLFTMEAGGPAALGGAMTTPVDTPGGIFTRADIEPMVKQAEKKHWVGTSMIEIEQTSNRGGGSIWPIETIAEITDLAREKGVVMHMDGARLFNATVASGIAAAEYAQHFDTLWIDLSKGLGCPVGSVLTGSRDFIEKAWPWKHRLGGAMRQAGVIAAAGLYALENNIDRLAEDHANAAQLAEGLAAIDGITLKWGMPQTNLVFLNVEDTGLTGPEIAAGLAERGISIGIDNDRELRAVTHLDVTSADMDDVIAAMSEVVSRK